MATTGLLALVALSGCATAPTANPSSAAVGAQVPNSPAPTEETSTDATLFVTYLASGDCGTVVMKREGGDWIITEQSQECAQ